MILENGKVYYLIQFFFYNKDNIWKDRAGLSQKISSFFALNNNLMDNQLLIIKVITVKSYFHSI